MKNVHLRAIAAHVYKSTSQRFPVFHSSPEIIHLEIFMFGAGLFVKFQPTDHATTVVFAQEFGIVGKVVDLGSKVSQMMLGTRKHMVELAMKKDRRAMIKVARPSRMKIQAQPGLPPTPSICTMAAASRPPNDPARAAAEKKMAARTPNSERLYQHER